MNAEKIIAKYYTPGSEIWRNLMNHSKLVAYKALQVAMLHPELNADTSFIGEAALIHDIGIFLTHAPSVHCQGYMPYICHGYLGAELLRKEGYDRHARVCERHTGVGLYADEIIKLAIPIPIKDYIPETIEEKIICYADKFYSKAHPERALTMDEITSHLKKYGDDKEEVFREWHKIFG